MALRRPHHDGDDREETHLVQRDQSSPAAREEPVQAGQYAHPAQLEEEAAAAILCPAHRQRTDHHGVLGHGHLRGTKAQGELTAGRSIDATVRPRSAPTPLLVMIIKVFSFFLFVFFFSLIGCESAAGHE